MRDKQAVIRLYPDLNVRLKREGVKWCVIRDKTPEEPGIVRWVQLGPSDYSQDKAWKLALEKYYENTCG